mmetsp:Transcript_46788/g.152075  ORF Transcript_46788/g.152075 Transcript_46788/m.152075 type:complete len:357 (+) Transcript_46788:260-1330(+)
MLQRLRRGGESEVRGVREQIGDSTGVNVGVLFNLPHEVALVGPTGTAEVAPITIDVRSLGLDHWLYLRLARLDRLAQSLLARNRRHLPLRRRAAAAAAVAVAAADAAAPVVPLRSPPLQFTAHVTAEGGILVATRHESAQLLALLPSLVEPHHLLLELLQNHARTPRQAALRHVDIGKDVVAHVQELLAAATRHLLDHACVSAGVLPAQLHAKRLTQHPIGRRHRVKRPARLCEEVGLARGDDDDVKELPPPHAPRQERLECNLHERARVYPVRVCDEGELLARAPLLEERLARLWVEIDKPLDVLHHLALERRLHVRAKERALDGTKKLRVARAASGVEGGHGVSDQGARVKPVD